MVIIFSVNIFTTFFFLSFFLLKVPSDTTLLRFLRARDFNLEKSKESLSRTFLWRKKHNVDQILCVYEIPQVIKDYYPGCWHHYDKGICAHFSLKSSAEEVLLRKDIIFIKYVVFYRSINY